MVRGLIKVGMSRIEIFPPSDDSFCGPVSVFAESFISRTQVVRGNCEYDIRNRGDVADLKARLCIMRFDLLLSAGDV